MDPENRYLAAFNQLGPIAQDLYQEYGDLMEVMPANRNKLAQQTGSSVNTVRQVIEFVEVWGGPNNNSLQRLRAEEAPRPASHYIIPDAHFARKDQSYGFVRAERLGTHMGMHFMRCERKGQQVRFICLGDWWDMVSLCFYEKDNASFGLQSVREDIDCGAAAMGVMMDAFYCYLKERGIEEDSPRMRMASFHFTNGNHEARLDKALRHAEHGPMLKGLPQIRAICEDYGWTFHPYMQPANVDGVAYAHCLPSGVMGRAIGGVNATKSLLDKMMVSCVVGHSHLWDISVRTDAFGGKRFALVAGCYYEDVPSYAQSTARMWWRGVTILNGVQDGCLVRSHAAVSIDDMVDVVGF